MRQGIRVAPGMWARDPALTHPVHERCPRCILAKFGARDPGIALRCGCNNSTVATPGACSRRSQPVARRLPLTLTSAFRQPDFSGYFGGKWIDPSRFREGIGVIARACSGRRHFWGSPTERVSPPGLPLGARLSWLDGGEGLRAMPREIPAKSHGNLGDKLEPSTQIPLRGKPCQSACWIFLARFLR